MTKAGRPKTNYDETPARFPEGTFKRINAVLREEETRADFLRAAVDKELLEREAARDVK